MRQIPTAAIYSTGTVSVSAAGVVTVAGGGVFTSAMVGRFMKVYYDDSFFEIAFYSAPNVTLRSWPGDIVAAQTYSIFQTIYTVDPLFGQVFDVTYQTPLIKRSQSYFNKIDPSRTGTSTTPIFWAFAGLNSVGSIQIEIYPVPTSVISLRVDGKLKASTLGDSDIPYLPEDLIEALALINCYRQKELQDPKAGWAERAASQIDPENPSGYPALLNMYFDEDYELDARTQRVRDVTEEPLIPSDDNFALSHDVE